MISTLFVSIVKFEVAQLLKPQLKRVEGLLSQGEIAIPPLWFATSMGC